MTQVDWNVRTAYWNRREHEFLTMPEGYKSPFKLWQPLPAPPIPEEPSR